MATNPTPLDEYEQHVDAERRDLHGRVVTALAQLRDLERTLEALEIDLDDEPLQPVPAAGGS